MQRKFLAVMCGLLITAVVMVGSALAAVGDGSAPFLRIAGAPDSVNPAQIRIITPTPTPANLEGYPTPLASEAGRDIGIVIGAALLVLIVIGGVFFGLKVLPKRKARD